MYFRLKVIFFSSGLLIILAWLSRNFWNNESLIRSKLTSWDGVWFEILLSPYILEFSPLNKSICNYFFQVFFLKKYTSKFESSHPKKGRKTLNMWGYRMYFQIKAILISLGFVIILAELSQNFLNNEVLIRKY